MPRPPRSFAQLLVAVLGLAGATLWLARSSRDDVARSPSGAAHLPRPKARVSTVRVARRASALLGTLLIVLGVGGLVLLLTSALASGALFGDTERPLRDGATSAAVAGVAPGIAAPATAVLAATLVPVIAATAMVDVPATAPASATPIQAAAAPVVPPTAAPAPTPTTDPFLPITRVLLPRTRLDTDVVAADLVEKDGGVTWEVPAFRAGHVEGSAGAGQDGNAVLLGHVTSRQSGNVFQRLDKVKLDDEVQVFSGSALYEYRVVDVKSVARDDVSVLDPTETPSVSLITCTGLWNPVIWDYMERLVVRAELVG